MKNVNNWAHLILGFLATIYGYFLILMILMGIFSVMTNEYIKFTTFITSTETIQHVLMTILLIISGDYLMAISIDKEAV